MISTIDIRLPLASIQTVFTPIQEFWRRHLDDAKPHGAPAALDLLLAHLLLELHPGQPLIVDCAANTMAGSATVMAVNHQNEYRVLSTATGVVAGALAEYTAAKRGQSVHTITADAPIPETIDGTVLLLDASELKSDAESLLNRLLERPNRLVIVFGIGSIGHCLAAENLCRNCGSGTGRRMWLVRELAESIATSQLAVIASERHPHVQHIIDRLGLRYRGNFRFIEMLEQTVARAIADSGADELAATSHPCAQTLRNQVDEAKRAANDAKRQIEVLTAQLKHYERIADSSDDAMKLAALSTEIHAIRNTLSFRTAERMRRVRRKLAPEGTISHKVFKRILRMARRITRMIRPVR